MQKCNCANLTPARLVITHTDAVSVPGWSGAGYVILDPDTGAGAWKISGGANGGSIKGEIQSLILTFLVAPLLAALSVLSIPAGILALILGASTLARVIAVIGFSLTQLAGLAGFDRMTLAITRMIIASVLVFNLLAFSPAVVIAPIALQLFVMWMMAVFAVELTLALLASAGAMPWSRPEYERYA